MLRFEFDIISVKSFPEKDLRLDMLIEKIQSDIEDFGFDLVGGIFGIEFKEEEENEESAS